MLANNTDPYRVGICDVEIRLAAEEWRNLTRARIRLRAIRDIKAGTYVGDDIPAVQLKVLVLAVPHMKGAGRHTRYTWKEVLDGP